MEKEKFLQLFAEQFDDTPATEFTMDTVFKSLDEWSSLMILSIISMVDEEYDKQITGADLRSVDTIAQLFDLVQSK